MIVNIQTKSARLNCCLRILTDHVILSGNSPQSQVFRDGSVKQILLLLIRYQQPQLTVSRASLLGRSLIHCHAEFIIKNHEKILEKILLTKRTYSAIMMNYTMMMN